MKEFYLANYKSLCAEIDDISDQMQKLSQELDTLEDGTMCTRCREWLMNTTGLKDLKRFDKRHQLMLSWNIV